MPVVATIKNRSEAFLRKHKAKERRLLYKAGGYVRTTLRRTFKVRKKTSIRGQVPNAHSHPNNIKRLVVFRVDQANDDVSIGLTKTQGANKDIGGTLQFGGIAKVYHRRDKRMVTHRIRRRPFMEAVVESPVIRQKLLELANDTLKG